MVFQVAKLAQVEILVVYQDQSVENPDSTLRYLTLQAVDYEAQRRVRLLVSLGEG